MKKNEPNEVLILNKDNTITLPNGIILKVVSTTLGEPVYGTRIINYFTSFKPDPISLQTIVPLGRENGIVQGYIMLPKGMSGDGTCNIYLKDNHGKGGHNDKQYIVRFKYAYGGKIYGINLLREHHHPTTEQLNNIIYQNQPEIDAGVKVEFIITYQDTTDNGVRLRMFIKKEEGLWLRVFDHVDYGDGKMDRPYRGRSGIQDSTKINGAVKDYYPSSDVVEEYYKTCRGKRIDETILTDRLRFLFSQIGTFIMYTREIEKDESNLHDGVDDPLSYGDKIQIQ